MKKTILFLVASTFLAIGQTLAQSSTQQNLNDAIQATGTIQQGISTEEEACNQLIKEITILGNPNVTLFNTQINTAVNQVLDNSDNVNYFVGEAKQASTIAFSSQEIDYLTNDLVALNDDVMYFRSEIESALEAQNNSVALNYIGQLKNVLASQKNDTDVLISKIEAIKMAVKRYTVCIKLVDNQGNVMTSNDLFGYFAINAATGESFYPTNQEGTCFENLAPGTYRFDSHDGYWSGTSSEIVTLTDALVSSNGTIEVRLVYWSE